MDNTIIAYAAGLIDGEGTITLTKQGKGKTRSAAVTMSSTTIELLEFMKSHFGGHIIKLKSTNPNWKQAWHWQISYNRSLEVLELVAPYLLEPRKRQRAELILLKYKAVTPRNGQYTSELLEDRVQFETEFFAI